MKPGNIELQNNRGIELTLHTIKLLKELTKLSTSDSTDNKHCHNQAEKLIKTLFWQAEQDSPHLKEFTMGTVKISLRRLNH